MRGPGRKRLLIAAGVLLICAIAMGLMVLLASRPFTRQGSAERLQHLLNARVEIKDFKQSYFPYAGYVAENVMFLRQLSPGTPVQPFITVKRLTVRASYFGLFRKPHRITSVRAEGLHLTITGGGMDLSSQHSEKSDAVAIDELSFEQAILDVGSSDHERGPLTFSIHSARFLNIGPQSTVAFSSKIHIPEPPGEFETKGWIGPWRDDHGSIRSTPITGSYVLREANLGHYHSLVGIVASDGQFTGTLSRLGVKGLVTSPDFGVRESGHHYQVRTQFAGSVDLKNGDVELPAVQAEFGKTAFTGTVKIAGRPKVVNLNVSHGKGEAQDLILLFSSAPRSPIAGPITFAAKTSLEPGDRPFKQRVRLDGEFSIDPAHFSSPKTQHGVDKLSAESQGQHSQLAEDNEAVSDLHGNVVLQNGTARLSPVTFDVPGASARMAGTYSLITKRVNFNGKMRMKATLSQATTGVKSVFLKILDPFYKKKNAGAELPVQMDGIYGHTHFSVGLSAKK